MTVNLDKALEQIDKQDFGKTTENSHLVSTVQHLRKKPLRDFSIEDLRLLIGQNFNLDILIPLALDRLKENILAEADHYEGDLLTSVLESDTDYWVKNKEHWQTVNKLFTENRQLFESDNTFRQLRKSFERFDKINASW